MLIKEPKKVAELLATFLEWKAAQGLEINSVYFAAPPTEMKFILDVRTGLFTGLSSDFFYSINQAANHLKKIFKEKRYSCSNSDRND